MIAGKGISTLVMKCKEMEAGDTLGSTMQVLLCLTLLTFKTHCDFNQPSFLHPYLNTVLPVSITTLS